MKRISLMLTLLLGIGCSIRPATTAEMGMTDVSDSIEVHKGLFGAGFKVKTSKDTKHHLTVAKVTWNKEAGCFEMVGLDSDYNGSASTVVTAEVERMKAAVGVLQGQATLTIAQGQAIAQVTKAVSEGIMSVEQGAAAIMGIAISPLSGAKASLPGGGSVQLGTVPQQTVPVKP